MVFCFKCYNLSFFGSCVSELEKKQYTDSIMKNEALVCPCRGDFTPGGGRKPPLC